MALLAAAACAGVWARLAGFGGRGLAVDEALSLRVAETILQYGLPRLLDGGFYAQGLIPHYLMAGSVALFGANETALRLPALLAGLALPAILYRYARAHASPAIASALAAAALVSSWQVELSRFGRMYAIFGCVTLLFLTRLDRAMAGGGQSDRYGAHLWAVAAVLCHAEGALLSPLLFAPLLDWNGFRGWAERIRYTAVTGVFVAGIAAFAMFDFRRWGVEGLYPAGYASPAEGFFRSPGAVLWWSGLDGRSALMWTALILAATLGWAVLQVRRSRLDERGAITALAVSSALVHQLAWTGAITFLLAARSQNEPQRSHLWRRLGWIALAAVVWPAVAFWSGDLSAGGIRRLFFGWPDAFEALVLPWSSAYPALGVGIAVAVVFGWWSGGNQPWVRLVMSPAGVVAYGWVCLGLVQYFYESIRYQYFLYPTMLAALATVFGRTLGQGRGALAFLAFFVVAGDFDPAHLAGAGDDEVEYRMGRFRSRENAWYPRSDYRGAATAVKDLTHARDILVIIGTAEPVAYYLDGAFVRYLDRKEHPFWEQSRHRGTVELWTGRRLLSTGDEVRTATAGSREVLLVRRVPGDLKELDPELIWGNRLVAVHQEFVSVDGDVDVVRVELAAQPSSPKP